MRYFLFMDTQIVRAFFVLQFIIVVNIFSTLQFGKFFARLFTKPSVFGGFSNGWKITQEELEQKVKDHLTTSSAATAYRQRHRRI